MHRTGPAVWFLSVGARLGAGPAGDRPYVMRRKLFTFAAAVSLLLCVALCVLWVRSGRAYDQWLWLSPRRFCGLVSWRGQVIVMYAPDVLKGGTPAPPLFVWGGVGVSDWVYEEASVDRPDHPVIIGPGDAGYAIFFPHGLLA